MNNPPGPLSVTRLSLHRLAEHILAAALYQQTGRIGLCASPGGIATPAFGPDSRVIAVDLDSLVVRSTRGERREPVSTLRAAGEFVGITPGGPSSVYSLATPCEPDAPLTLDRAVMQVLANWYALGNDALARAAEQLADESPSEAILWPEHFDLAISAGGVNYGFSPGDDFSPSPYAYVGPHDPPPSSTFWNAPFGAFRNIDDIASVDDAVAFLLDGEQRLATAITTTQLRSQP